MIENGARAWEVGARGKIKAAVRVIGVSVSARSSNRSYFERWIPKRDVNCIFHHKMLKRHLPV